MSDYKLIDITRLTKFKDKLLGILTYSSPATNTSNTSIEFIDTVSQTNGKISATKKKVSTFTGNTAGLVPAPRTGDTGKFLGSDGKWNKPTGTTYNNYTTSTTTKAGTAGLVPAPGTGDTGKFLKSDSGWSSLPTASTTNSGIVKLSSATNSNAENIAATPKAVSSAIKGLSCTDPSADTSTSTTFISNISQTNGKVSATKKKLPTFAGSSQPGIVSASKELSENYLLNATGGWTSIDEELDSDSTNPVQNKTLYNLETYHTLKKKGRNFYIDDGLNIPEKTSVKLYFDRDLIDNNTDGGLTIYQKNKPKHVLTTVNGSLTINYTNRTTIVGDGSNVLTAHNVLVGFNIENLPAYTKIFFKKGTAFEMFLNSDEKFRIVGDPIVGRYKYEYKYIEAPTWNITANAVVYASGLKIQWGNFTNHSTDVEKETYFPVKFEKIPSMSFTFDTNVGSGALDAHVMHRDIPYAFDALRWKLPAAADNTYGYWQAIGY